MNGNKEVIEFINNHNLNDVFNKDNLFYKNYNCNLFIYIRVSTEKQEFGRQILELYKWAKDKKITIDINYIYCDKYTGKKTTREAYQQLHKQLKNNDYLVVSELNRLGRNWDDTKKEWQFLTENNINVIVLDNEMLSAKLPTEPKEKITLEYKFIRDIVFNAINYVASKKIEEVSRTTKDGIKKARLNGKKIGRSRSEWATKENFIKTLEYMLTNHVGQLKATLMTRYPKDTFRRDLNQCYKKYKTKNYNEILQNVKEEKDCQQF